MGSPSRPSSLYAKTNLTNLLFFVFFERGETKIRIYFMYWRNKLRREWGEWLENTQPCKLFIEIIGCKWYQKLVLIVFSVVKFFLKLIPFLNFYYCVTFCICIRFHKLRALSFSSRFVDQRISFIFLSLFLAPSED